MIRKIEASDRYGRFWVNSEAKRNKKGVVERNKMGSKFLCSLNTELFIHRGVV